MTTPYERLNDLRQQAQRLGVLELKPQWGEVSWYMVDSTGGIVVRVLFSEQDRRYQLYRHDLLRLGLNFVKPDTQEPHVPVAMQMLRDAPWFMPLPNILYGQVGRRYLRNIMYVDPRAFNHDRRCTVSMFCLPGHASPQLFVDGVFRFDLFWQMITSGQIQDVSKSVVERHKTVTRGTAPGNRGALVLGGKVYYDVLGGFLSHVNRRQIKNNNNIIPPLQGILARRV